MIWKFKLLLCNRIYSSSIWVSINRRIYRRFTIQFSKVVKTKGKIIQLTCNHTNIHYGYNVFSNIVYYIYNTQFSVYNFWFSKSGSTLFLCLLEMINNSWTNTQKKYINKIKSLATFDVLLSACFMKVIWVAGIFINCVCFVFMKWVGSVSFINSGVLETQLNFISLRFYQIS